VDIGVPYFDGCTQPHDTIQGILLLMGPGFSWLMFTLFMALAFQEKKELQGAMFGLFAYPVLMAADILLYRCVLSNAGLVHSVTFFW